MAIFMRRPDLNYTASMSVGDLITPDPDILGGTPVFKGTRVPVKTLFEYLENDYSLEEVLECFPSGTCEIARELLESAEGLAVNNYEHTRVN